MVSFRIATIADAAGLLPIYAPYILHSAFTFEAEVPSTEEFAGRITKYLHTYPWIVCEAEGAIVGYVYAAAHRERTAYQWTCESSVYIAEGWKGRGLAVQLYKALLGILKIQGFRNVYAGITLPNDPSVRLHEKLGFSPFAFYENVGFKLGSWHKVGWWGLAINEFSANPAPPRLFSKLDPDHYSELLAECSAGVL